MVQTRSRRIFAASGRLSCNRFSTSTAQWISLIIDARLPDRSHQKKTSEIRSHDRYRRHKSHRKRDPVLPRRSPRGRRRQDCERLSSDQRADQHRGGRRTGDHAARRLAGQRPEQAVAEATGPAAPRSSAVDRPRRSDDGLRQAQMRDSAALLHRSAVAVEDRWPLADRAKGFYDRDCGNDLPQAR